MTVQDGFDRKPGLDSPAVMAVLRAELPQLAASPFGAAVVMRQIDVGVPAERIQETQDAAKLTLLAAARDDGEREFCAGYTAAVDTRLRAL